MLNKSKAVSANPESSSPAHHPEGESAARPDREKGGINVVEIFKHTHLL